MVDGHEQQRFHQKQAAVQIPFPCKGLESVDTGICASGAEELPVCQTVGLAEIKIVEMPTHIIGRSWILTHFIGQ